MFRNLPSPPPGGYDDIESEYYSYGAVLRVDLFTLNTAVPARWWRRKVSKHVALYREAAIASGSIDTHHLPGDGWPKSKLRQIRAGLYL